MANEQKYAVKSKTYPAWFGAFDLWQADKSLRVTGDHAWAESVCRRFPDSEIVATEDASS